METKIKIRKHVRGYKQLKNSQIAELKKMGFKGSKIREMMVIWDNLFTAEEQKHNAEINWFEGMLPFKDPEYRIHPLMGYQVRSRHHFEPTELTSEERIAQKKTKPRVKPTLKPYEADPAYRDPKEPVHGTGDLKGVKQYPLTLKEEMLYFPPIKVKSTRLQRSVDILELKAGYDHKTNKHVLYSPLAYNERWDRQSQVIWLRIIGMSPKRIGKRLDIKYDTVKNWLRALKDQPLVATSQYDWAVRQVEGRGEYSSKFSSVEAKPRAMEAVQYDRPNTK